MCGHADPDFYFEVNEMKAKATALLLVLVLTMAVLAGCASDVFGDWVDASGNVFSFSTGTVSATPFGSECPYVASKGVISVQVENPLFGGTMVLDGTYEKKGDVLTLSFGQADALNFVLTRY